MCSIAGAMVSHAGHINTGEQASVTHSCVCSSPKAPQGWCQRKPLFPSHTGTTLVFFRSQRLRYSSENGVLGTFHSCDGYGLSRRILPGALDLFFSPFHIKWINYKGEREGRRQWRIWSMNTICKYTNVLM